MYSYEQYCESAKYIEALLGDFQPEILMVLGSGLGYLSEVVKEHVTIPYKSVPHMHGSTIAGHAGNFVAGVLGGKNVLIMQGRLHIFEGNSAEDVAYPIRVANLLGADKMIITNAAGGVSHELNIGDIMMISDVIKFTGPNPLIGPNIDAFGPRFQDMTYVFSSEYRSMFRAIAESQGLSVQEGVYFFMTGSQFETPAEIRAIRMLGGDAVGMSTVPECIVAAHCGMKILGLSLITNKAAGMLDQPLTHDEVLIAGEYSKGRLLRLIQAFIERM